MRATGDFVLFSSMKNEGPFVLEWVAYHHAIGFNKIVIVSNDCDDGTDEILGALQDMGIITHYNNNVTKTERPQQNAALISYDKKVLCDGDWAISLDADEFLNVKLGDKTVSALSGFLEGKSGILLNWRIFGDSGIDVFSGRLISQSYTKCAEENDLVNNQVKTFFHKSKNVSGFGILGFHRPKLVEDAGWSSSDFLNGKGVPISDEVKTNLRWLQGRDRSRNHTLSTADCGYDIAQINHYCVRSSGTFALKKSRGRGYSPKEKINTRHDMLFYEQMNCNDTEDRSILFWETKVDDILQSWLTDEPLSAALKNAIKLTEKAMISQPDLDTKRGSEEAEQQGMPISMPAKEQAYLKRVYKSAKVILEYGGGGSTVYAANNGKHVLAVESDSNWVEKITEEISHSRGRGENAKIVHVDIGKTKAWGYPADSSGWENYHKYPLSVWSSPGFEEPDVVLIDGRFRMACFAAVVLNAKTKTIVLFDDYANRPEYHQVESLVKPEKIVGRMAVFTIDPARISSMNIPEVISWFFRKK